MTAGSGIELAHAAALPLPQGGAMPTSLEWQSLERMATMLADSSLVPYRLRGKAGDVAVILLAAREYGVPPLMALSKLPVVNGTPAPMGELMVALILRAGHKITADTYNADGTRYAGGPITEATYAECVSRRAGDDEDYVLRFTVAEAVTAQLVELRDGKPYARAVKMRNGQPVMRDGEQVLEVLPWELYTVNMLRWRAVANAARLRFPDVLLGLSYLPEELGATVDAEGAPIVTTAEERGRRAPGPAPTVESRTAGELAEEAYRQGNAVAISNALGWAQRNGIDGELVTVGEEHRAALDLGHDQPVTLADVLRALIDRIEAGKGPLVMDAQPDSPAQEPPAPASAPEPPASGAQEPDAGPAPQNAAQGPDPDTVAATVRAAGGVLVEADPEVLLRTYRRAEELGVLHVDVTDVVTDDDRDTLDLRDDVVVFGQLLMVAGGYVRRHGRAVRALWPEQDPAAPDPLAE